MQKHPSEIRTSRLILIPLTRESILAEQSANGDYREFSEQIGCRIHPEWPPEHWEPHVFDFFLAQFDRYPEQAGWNRYVALPQADGTRQLIGSLGAFSKIDDPLIAEIGYGILPSFEGQGFATEGTRAVIELLRLHEVESVIAHTFPTLKRSLRAMEKCGLTFDGDGEEQGTVRYRLQLR